MQSIGRGAVYYNKIHVAQNRGEMIDPRMAEAHLPAVYYQEDEISLLDIWLVLVKRRKLILAIFFLCVLASLYPILTNPPIYESRAVLEIGQVTELGVLENRGSMIQRLEEAYRVEDSSEGVRGLPQISSVGFDKKSAPNAVTLTAQAYSAAEAQSFLRLMTDNIVAQHQKFFEQALQVYQKQVDNIDSQLEANDMQVEQLSERILGLEKTDPSQAAFLAVEKAKTLAQKPELLDRKIKLSMAMSAPRSQPTTYLREPTLPINKIKPKRAMYLTMAVIVGAILGIFMAFFIEFIAKARQQLKARAGEQTPAPE